VGSADRVGSGDRGADEVGAGAGPVALPGRVDVGAGPVGVTRGEVVPWVTPPALCGPAAGCGAWPASPGDTVTVTVTVGDGSAAGPPER
jgi:hypothetical protein